MSCPYFDLSFQHARAAVLRRMRRFGDPDAFLSLLASIRALAPDGRHPQQRDLRLPRRDRGRRRESERLPDRGRLDAIGVFGYSDEDGTEAAGLDGQLSADEIEARARTSPTWPRN